MRHCRVFYRGCDYKLEVFKEKYDLFYTVRSVLPAWFADWSPRLEEVRKALEAGFILPVRGYDKRGRVVVIVRQSKADPAIFYGKQKQHVLRHEPRGREARRQRQARPSAATFCKRSCL